MLPLTQEALMELSINFLFYFIIGSLGAFLKDLYETITKKEEKIRLSEVLIGGACATFICYGLQDTWLKGLSLNLIVLITFVCGILGFELFGNLTTISKFKQLLTDIIDLRNRIMIVPKDPATPPPEIPPTIVPPTTTTTPEEPPKEEKNNPEEKK